MKYLILSLPLTVLWSFGFFAESQAQSNPDFYLAANGVTVMCPAASVGDTGEVNGVTYTKRIISHITSANVETTCTSGITDMSGKFYADFTFNGDISSWDVSSVSNMANMFYMAISFNGDISSWDVSGVTDMSGMFFNTSAFNQDLSSWDVSSVSNMVRMFYMASSFNGDISSWDVSGVTLMAGMFLDAIAFNQDLTSWDVSKVTNMGQMFFRASLFNGDLSTWNVSNVTNMHNMFLGASSFNSDLSGWDVSKVTDMSEMFGGASSFNGDISSWDVSSATNLSGLFGGASSFNQDISSWDVSSQTDLSRMFQGAGSFNQDLNGWDVSKVTNMDRMFSGASSFNGDLSTWNVSNVTNMNRMFLAASSFNRDISSWDVSGVTNISGMFSRASAFNQNLSSWDVTVNNLSGMFSDSAFNQDLSSWDVSGVTNISEMFSGSAFNQDLSSWDVSGVTNMSEMFSGSAFNQDLSSWDVSGVTNMSGMFSSTDSFNQDLSSWDVSGVTNMDGMFANARSFNQNLNDWDVSGVTNMSRMFANASSFNQNLNDWDVSGVTNMSGMFNSAVIFNGDIRTWDVSGVTDMSNMFYNARNFNQDLSGWCVKQIASPPSYFDYNFNESAWVLPRPNWGSCPFSLSPNGVTLRCPDVDVGVIGNLNGIIYTKRTKEEITPTNAETTCTTGVTDMSDMFNNASTFNGDIGSWDVSAVTDMGGMFQDAISFNQDLSDWDVASVTDMANMFNGANNFNQNLSGWEVSNVTNMDGMFNGTSAFNQDLSIWCVDQITSKPLNFDDGAHTWVLPRPDWGTCPFSLAANGVTVMCPDVNIGDTGKVNGVTYTKRIKEEITPANAPTTCTSGITDMSELLAGSFSVPSNFNNDISHWDVSNVTDMSNMFNNARSFNRDISHWDVSNVTNMGGMFSNSTYFNQDISKWDVSGVTNMDGMFNYAFSFNQDLSGWCVSQITSKPLNFDNSVYTGASKWVLPQPNWGTCPGKEITISGNAGWRMLSLPVSDVTVSTLAGQNLVQGISGADAFYNDGNNYESAAANLFYYLDTTADNWQGFADFDAQISSGQGFIWYMFDNNNVNSVELPFTLSATGTNPSTDVIIPINPNDNFTLIGNPFAGNLDASDVSGWGDLQATARTWDPDAGTAGDYVNTTATTAPFTGFFVEKSVGASGDITIPVASASSKQADSERFRIALNLQGVNDNDIAVSDQSTSVLFREGAAHEWDVYDATKLVPLLSSYATIGIAGNRREEERIKSIDSRPLDFEDVLDLPLAFNVFNFGGQFELSAEIESLPESWSVLLHDNETGETIDLRSASHSFRYQSEAQKVSEIKNKMPEHFEMSTTESMHRFTLTVATGESVSTPGPDELPESITLKQNYPNPFNPSTVIRYELPEASNVTLQVYDMNGRQIATLINGQVQAGVHNVSFDGSNLSSGVYFYRLQTPNQTITKKLTLIK